MKFLFAVLICSLIYCQANASLITIGTAEYDSNNDGTAERYNLIWDDDNNGNSIVWLDYTHFATDWLSQNSWAAGLNGLNVLTYNIDSAYTVDWGTNSWHLPSAGTNPVGDGPSNYNITTSDMGHLYYTELELQSYPDRGYQGVTSAELNATNFDNLIPAYYWTDTEYFAYPGYAWSFSMYEGMQNVHHDDQTGDFPDANYGVALRSAQVAHVPEPSTIFLMGLGLLGIAGIGRKGS